MTLKEFKTEAQQRGNYFDNSENAAHEWAKSWGLTYWRLVWFYKEFRVGGMVYRSGMWRGRWGGHTVTECTIDGEAVSKYRFEKALATFTAPEMTDEEKARHEAQERNREAQLAEYWRKYHEREERRAQRARKTEADRRQLRLNFA